jgi:F-type H+-transporting ATPase subunit b
MATVTDPVIAEGAALGTVPDAAPGMPQLDFSTFPNQIFWLLVMLAATYFILSRIALPRIGAVLAERQGTITNDIAAAEDLRRRADDAEKAYDKALADARGEAQRIAQGARDEMQGDLDEALARADAEIAARTAESEKQIAVIRDEASRNVREVAREVAAEIVTMLGDKPDAARIESAVDNRMERQA